MPKKSLIMTPDVVAKIAAELKKETVSTRQLIAIAVEIGIKRPTPRMIIEGLESNGWLLYEDSNGCNDATFGIMDYHNGRVEDYAV